MKRFKTLVLGLCLIIGLSACGSEEEKTFSDYTEEELAELSEEEIEALLEAELERLTAKEEDEKDDSDDKSDKEDKKSTKTAEPKQEILDANWYSGLIQIGDTLIELPIQFSELLDMGFEYELYAKEWEMDERSKDYVFEKGDSVGAYFYKDGTLMFSASGGSSSMEGYHTIEEINPTFHKVEPYTTEYPVYYPRNLKVGDSFTLIEETFGKPYKIDSYGSSSTHYYGSPYDQDGGMSISWSKDTQKITRLSISRSLEVNEDLTLETLTQEDVKYGSKVIVDITMKYFPKHNGELDARVLKDGQLYQLQLTASGMPPFHWSEPLTEKVYEKSGEDGIYRMIATDYDRGFEYCVYDGNIVIAGHLYVDDLVQDTTPNYVELFLDTAIEIVESISYTNS